MTLYAGGKVAYQTYPIDLIEIDYVQKRISYAELRAKYGITTSTLAYHSRRRKWQEKKQKYRLGLASKVSKCVENTQVKEQKGLIERLEALRDIKLKLESDIMLSNKEKTGEKTVNKEVMALINKSKDPVGELTKIIELLKGNATSRLELKKEEKEQRFNRLKSYISEPILQ